MHKEHTPQKKEPQQTGRRHEALSLAMSQPAMHAKLPTGWMGTSAENSAQTKRSAAGSTQLALFGGLGASATRQKYMQVSPANATATRAHREYMLRTRVKSGERFYICGVCLGVGLECSSRRQCSAKAEHAETSGGIRYGTSPFFCRFSSLPTREKKVRTRRQSTPEKRARDACIAPTAQGWGSQTRQSLLPKARRRFLCLRALSRGLKSSESASLLGVVVGC